MKHLVGDMGEGDEVVLAAIMDSDASSRVTSESSEEVSRPATGPSIAIVLSSERDLPNCVNG